MDLWHADGDGGWASGMQYAVCAKLKPGAFGYHPPPIPLLLCALPVPGVSNRTRQTWAISPDSGANGAGVRMRKTWLLSARRPLTPFETIARSIDNINPLPSMTVSRIQTGNGLIWRTRTISEDGHNIARHLGAMGRAGA